MRRFIYLIVFCTLLTSGIPALAQGEDQTIERATWLLRKATLIHRNGAQNILLRALRQLRDPQLEPLFSDLVQRAHPSMKIHGILGLAEINPDRTLDLALVADITARTTQAQLVSAAMDADLLSLEDSKQLLTWPGLDDAVKVIVAAQLVAANEPIDATVLDEAAESDNLALAGMATILRHQLNRPGSAEQLAAISQSTAPNRDSVRALLLQTAMRYELESLADWALSITQEPDVDSNLEYRALRAALMFNQPQAVNVWMHRYDTADSEAQRIRLAILALDLAGRLDRRLFEPMQEDDLPLIQLVGRIGAAMAARQPAADLIAELIQQNNVLASRWALQYAEDAEPALARPVYLSLIRASVDGPDRFRSQRLEHAVLAAEQLADQGGLAIEAMANLLPQTTELTQEAVLMGLIRCNRAEALQVIDGAELKSRTGQSMALLLKAKLGGDLSDAQVERLSLIVRGGAGLEEPLRIQAAWVYLKLVQRNQLALASVLGGR